MEKNLEMLERLCCDFENASQLLKVIGRSAEDLANYEKVTVMREFIHEMFDSLRFIGEIMRERSNDLWTLLSELKEEKETTSAKVGVINETEGRVLEVYRLLNRNEQERIKKFCNGFLNGFRSGVDSEESGNT